MAKCIYRLQADNEIKVIKKSRKYEAKLLSLTYAQHLHTQMQWLKVCTFKQGGEEGEEEEVQHTVVGS